jgi:flagellar hook-basal body complex protein FliE
MTLAAIQQLNASRLLRLDDTDELPQIQFMDPQRGERFRNAIEYAVDQVDLAQTEASQQIESFIAGEQENLHEVMISMNQAKLSFQLMTEVRNKMMETYNELLRMQF